MPVDATWLAQQVPGAAFAKRSSSDGYVYFVDVAAKARGDGTNATMTALLKPFMKFVIVHGTGFAIKVDDDDDLTGIPDLADSHG